MKSLGIFISSIHSATLALGSFSRNSSELNDSFWTEMASTTLFDDSNNSTSFFLKINGTWRLWE